MKFLFGITLLIFTLNLSAQNIFRLLEQKEVQEIQKLITADPSAINTKNEWGVAPLHLAALSGFDELVSTMIDQGANVNITDSEGQTPLHWAAGSGYGSVVNLLLKNKAELNKKDVYGRTPFFLSVISNNIELVNVFIKLGANVNNVDIQGKKAIHLAVESYCSNEIIDFLLTKGTHIENNDFNKKELIHIAASSGYKKLVSILLDLPAEMTTANISGGSLLHSAAAGNMEKLAHMLIKQGFDINKKDNLGRTPLCIAEQLGSKETAQYLRLNGAVSKCEEPIVLSKAGSGINNILDSKLEITYTGNCGFMIQSGNTKVLIDAIQRDSYYTPTPTSAFEKMVLGQTPFNDIDFLLITHSDLDHYHPEMVLEFLVANPKTKLFTSAKTNQLIKDSNPALYSKIIGQLIVPNVKIGENKEYGFNTFSMKVMGTDHGGNYLNLCFLLKFEDMSVVHLGDFYAHSNLSHFESFDLENENIDIAMSACMFDIPSFKTIISEHIKPQYNIVMHLHKNDILGIERRLNENQAYSNTLLFKEPLQKMSFEKSAEVK